MLSPCNSHKCYERGLVFTSFQSDSFQALGVGVGVEDRLELLLPCPLRLDTMGRLGPA